MKKFLVIVFLLFTTPVLAATQWYQGSATAPLQGSTLINDIDTSSQNYAFDPLDRLLSSYRSGQFLTYKDASSITVTAGEIVVLDSGGTIKLMLRNTSDTTVTWADIDAGGEASSTTYYVYAVGASSSATTATYKISTSASAPSGVTYYKLIGSFYNDGSSNITTINNINIKAFGSYQSKSIGSTYQALSDGFVISGGMAAIDSSTELAGFTDGSSSPSTQVAVASFHTDNGTSRQYDGRYNSLTFPVKSGDYYKVTQSSYAGSPSSTFMYFVPIK